MAEEADKTTTTTTITIKKAGVYKEIRKTTEYIGVLTVTDNGGNIYDLVKATPEAQEMLDRFVREGCADISNYCKRRITAVTFNPINKDSDGTVDFTITFTEGKFPTKMLDAVKQDMFSYLVNSSVYKWLLLGNLASDRVQVYKGIADAFLRGVRTSLNADGAGEGGSEASGADNNWGEDASGAGSLIGSGSGEASGTDNNWGGAETLTLNI